MLAHLGCKDGVHDSYVVLSGIWGALQAQHARPRTALAPRSSARQRLVHEAEPPGKTARQHCRLSSSACRPPLKRCELRVLAPSASRWPPS